MPDIRKTLVMLAAAALLFTAHAACATPASRAEDKESVELKIRNMLECGDLSPYVSFSYPDYLRSRGNVVVLEHQYLGYMTSLEPGKEVKGLPYFSATVMLIKAYDKPALVLDKYLEELDGYMLQHDFEHHTISSVIIADYGMKRSAYEYGEVKPFAIPGRGYVVSGIVSADGPLQGLSFSEEFYVYNLPGNVNLRMVFKYPSPAQDNEELRNTIEAIMSSTIVHLNFFNHSGDTSLGGLKKN